MKSLIGKQSRIRLNNCATFWKQWEFLYGLDICKKLVSVGAIRKFIFKFFANQNFSRPWKTELLRKWIVLVLQAKFPFMGSLVKASAIVLGNSVVVIITVNTIIVLVFTKQPSAERYLANIFSPVFLWTFRKF